jgi:hypothetical protein
MRLALIGGVSSDKLERLSSRAMLLTGVIGEESLKLCSGTSLSISVIFASFNWLILKFNLRGITDSTYLCAYFR